MCMSSAEPGATTEKGMPIALIDLGDTLCDCTSALTSGMARLRASGEDMADWGLKSLPPHLEARRQKVMATPGFWRDLAPLPLGFELMRLLQAEGFGVHIVTKGPYDVPQAWADKVAWCRRHVPKVPVVVTDDKALVYGHVLVEDWLPYLARWQQRWSGLAIVPAQPWNVHATLDARVIRYDGRNRDEVQAALRAWRRSLKERSIMSQHRNYIGLNK